MHNLCPVQSTTSSSLWTTQTAPYPGETLKFHLEGFHRATPPVFKLHSQSCSLLTGFPSSPSSSSPTIPSLARSSQSSSYSTCSLSMVYQPMSHLTGVLSSCPTSSDHSERPLTCTFTSPPVIILRVMARLSTPTKHSNSTSKVTAIISRTTGPNYYP